MIQIVERTTCRSCGGQLAYLMDFGEQLVRWDKPEKVPLVLTKCSKCGLVQLRHTVSRDYLFRGDYPYRSGTTQTMRDHLKGIVHDVAKRVHLRPDDIVVDIGTNDGTLLNFYPQMVVKMGFEPMGWGPDKFDGMWANDFFSFAGFDSMASACGGYDEQGHATEKAKVITALSVFYDLDDPNAFLQDVKKALASDGLFVLQLNYLPDTLRNNAVGDLVAEHLTYWTLTTLNDILRRNGFYIDDYRFSPINGGSVIVFAKHGTGFQIGIPKGESDLDYQAFAKRILAVAIKVKSFLLEARDKGEPVDIIGASTRGSTFLQYIGVDTSVVRFVIERDRSKVGKSYLGLPIVSEETAFKNPPRYKIAMPYWFKAEILEREKPFLDGGGALVFPLPEPMAVTKDGEKAL